MAAGLGDVALPEGFTAAEGGGQSAEQQQFIEQKAMMLDAILTPEAKARLGRVSLVRKEQAQQVEMQLLNMASSGKLREKVTEERLIEIIEGQAAKRGTKVKIQRRSYFEDEEEAGDSDSELM